MKVPDAPQAAGNALLAQWRRLACFAGVVLLLICVYQVLGENGYFRLRARQQEVRRLEEDIRRLTEENQRLEHSIRQLRSDPGAIEQIAREELKMTKPGDVVYTLPPASPPKK